MAKFQLLEGVGHHQDPKADGGRGRIWKAGEVIESDKPLDRMFKFKFKRVPHNIIASKGSPIGGDTVLAEVEDRLSDEGKKKAQERDEREEAERLKEEPKTEVAEKTEWGENVTGEFEQAKEKELAVFKKGRKYIITKADDTSDPLSKALTRQRDVEKFIDAYDPAEEEPDDEDDDEPEDDDSEEE